MLDFVPYPDDIDRQLAHRAEEMREIGVSPAYLIRSRRGDRPIEGPMYPGRLIEVDEHDDIVQIPRLTPWGHPDPLSEVDWP